MMTPPSRIHHVNKRNPLNDAVMSKSDSPAPTGTTLCILMVEPSLKSQMILSRSQSI
ncbi:hypothetical protein BD293_4079 [Roseinatronobacter monicus]|uniref:Uncharacterized protein n=1 Tax=Roseinatronobacter monicus TaxID=393481 RepID=A0A543K4Z5_9RHOB|nr:hypothetical protein BD293_4079 [Roseinatronobacter monicus]